MRGRPTFLLLTALTLVAVGGGVWFTLHRGPGAPHDDAAAWLPIALQQVSHGRFEDLRVYTPHGTPRGFVLLLSDLRGWTPGMTELALHIAGLGAMVAGIDAGKLAANLEADPAGCVFPDGDLENLSHFVQAYYHLPTYLPPILAGLSSGATLAYATLAQAPAKTFAGAVSLDFCPSLALRKPLCKSGGLDFNPLPGDRGVELLPARELAAPWEVLQSAAGTARECDAATVSRFVAQVPQARQSAASDIGTTTDLQSAPWNTDAAAAFETLLAANAPAASTAPPSALGDLPLVWVPLPAGAAASDTFAIMLSGDGGWAGLDKDVATALTAAGIEVIGLDSLRYFWSARTPAGLARDLERMIGYYGGQLGKRRVVLIGYSQGADVLPFAVNRMTQEARSHVVLAAVMGMSEHALFEFHVRSWIGDDNSGPATLPEVDKIAGVPVLCIYGADERDSLCPQLDSHKATVVKLKGGHHFDGDYGGLARTILASARP